MRANWKVHVDFAWSCIVVMQQCEIHGFASYPRVSVDCFMTREYLTGKMLSTPDLKHKSTRIRILLLDTQTS